MFCLQLKQTFVKFICGSYFTVIRLGKFTAIKRSSGNLSRLWKFKDVKGNLST